jgi:hypothetical protein
MRQRLRKHRDVEFYRQRKKSTSKRKQPVRTGHSLILLAVVATANQATAPNQRFSIQTILRNPEMKLTDIIASGTNQSNLQDAWNTTQAADEFGKPLPNGEYIARIIQGNLKQSKANQTPGYSLTFEVIEPVEFKGRKFWHDCWLTPAAMPATKRDLGKLGVTSLEQLEKSPCLNTFGASAKLRIEKRTTERNRTA